MNELTVHYLDGEEETFKTDQPSPAFNGPFLIVDLGPGTNSGNVACINLSVVRKIHFKASKLQMAKAMPPKPIQ